MILAGQFQLILRGSYQMSSTIRNTKRISSGFHRNLPFS